MNVLFLMIALPDFALASNMYTDLVDVFIKNGHNVYPIAPALQGSPTSIRDEKGRKVLRVKTLPLFDVNPIRKGIANVLLPHQYKHAIEKYYKGIHFDLIIMPTPPITLVSVAEYYKKRDQACFYLQLRDIFPQNAVDLGMMSSKGILYRLFRRLEKKLYRCADYIGCMSPKNIEYIKHHNPEVSFQKLHILMNFQKPSPENTEKEDMKVKYKLQDKYVAIFGGNMGEPQKLENLLALAKACLPYKNVVFLLIGEGTHKNHMEQLAKEQGISNLIFKEFIPKNDFQKLVCQCEVGLINLNENFTIPNIPSKTLDYFDAGLPVLAAIDPNTDYGPILEEIGAGLYSIGGDLAAYKENFDRLYKNPALRKEMGKNGRSYFLNHMTPEIAYKIIMNHVQKGA